MNVELIQGDCLEIMSTLPQVDAVITDPPYGINANKMTLGLGKKEFFRGDDWDNKVIDISFLLNIGKYHCIFGGNYFTDKLPVNNNWGVWHKKNDDRSYSEAELIWTDFLPNVRTYHHHWGGEEKQHPTQKQLAVMKWIISYLPENTTILDPFMGSGSTGVACVQLNRNFIGIEIDSTYFKIAQERIRVAQMQPSLLETT